MDIREIDKKEMSMRRKMSGYRVPPSFTRGNIDDLIDELRRVPDFYPDKIEEIREKSSLEIIAFNIISNKLLVLDIKGLDKIEKIKELHLNSYKNLKEGITRVFLEEENRE